jgi:predicted transposase YdaD
MKRKFDATLKDMLEGSQVQRLKERLESPRLRRLADKVWGAAYILMGLRYEKEFIDQLFKGVLHMEESVTYQALIQEGLQKGRIEGVLEGVRKAVLRMGKNCFGRPATRQTVAALEAITNLEELEELLDRINTVQSWDELLPAASPRKGRRK